MQESKENLGMRRKKKKYGRKKKEIYGKNQRNQGKNRIRSRKYCSKRDSGEGKITVSTMIVQENENCKREILIILRILKERNKKIHIRKEKSMSRKKKSCTDNQLIRDKLKNKMMKKKIIMARIVQ